jgi:hypothetical protein
MREDVKTVKLDPYESGAVLKGLLELRNRNLKEGKDTDFVNEVLLKIAKTPTKRERKGRDEAR